jgi:septal ring factor EnvC (AmiA/AmiB activator)
MSEIEDLWKLQIDYGMLQKETDDLRAQLEKTESELSTADGEVAYWKKAFRQVETQRNNVEAERDRMRSALINIAWMRRSTDPRLQSAENIADRALDLAEVALAAEKEEG